MKKTINIFITFVLLFASVGSFAQQNNIADIFIKKMVKTLRDPKNVELSYTYQFGTDKDAKTQEGKAYMQGEQYKIIMNEQQTISDGSVIWSYLVEDQEVMISRANDGNDNTPFKLLSTLDRDYTAKFLGTNKENETSIELNNPKGKYKKVNVVINKDGTLKTAEILAEDNSKLIIEVTEMKTNQQYDEGFFTFDEKAHPEVEIIDMR